MLLLTWPSSSRCFASPACTSAFTDSICAFCTSAARARRRRFGLLLRELLRERCEIGEEMLVALTGDVGVLLARREVLRLRGVELRDAATARGAAAHVDVGGARGDRGADLARSWPARRRRPRQPATIACVRGVEGDLRVVDLLVQRVELAAVLGDLRLERGGFGALVVDLGGVRRRGQKGDAHRRGREHREGQAEQAKRSAVPSVQQQERPQSNNKSVPQTRVVRTEASDPSQPDRGSPRWELVHLCSRCGARRAFAAGQTGHPGLGAGSPWPETSGCDHLSSLPIAFATRCHVWGSHPSAASSTVVSWRRCTKAGRCVSPRLVTNSASGSTEGHVAVFGVTEHAARDELVAGHDERGAAVGVAEHLEDPLRDRDVPRGLGPRREDHEAQVEHRRPVVERPRLALAARELDRRIRVLRHRRSLAGTRRHARERSAPARASPSRVQCGVRPGPWPCSIAGGITSSPRRGARRARR